MKKVTSFFLAVCFFFVVYFCYIFFIKNTVNRRALYFVKSGSNLSVIASDLASSNIISNKVVFKIYSKIWSLFNGCAIVHVGEYLFDYKETYQDVLDKLCNGKSVMKTITIPEGFETREVIEKLNLNNDLIGNKIVFLEEGRLLPESYNFKSGTQREIVFEKMKNDLVTFIDQEWEKREQNDEIKTVDDALILASIVEKEAKTDEERPIIASVYLNRLKIGMRLDADPTAIYEITKGQYKLNRLLTKKDLKIKGDYNTYRKKGLPIKPICNAGKKSILAVLHPAKTDYLYFVAKEDLNGHYFSNNYKDHLKNINFVKSQKSGK